MLIIKRAHIFSPNFIACFKHNINATIFQHLRYLNTCVHGITHRSNLMYVWIDCNIWVSWSWSCLLLLRWWWVMAEAGSTARPHSLWGANTTHRLRDWIRPGSWCVFSTRGCPKAGCCLERKQGSVSYRLLRRPLLGHRPGQGQPSSHVAGWLSTVLVQWSLYTGTEVTEGGWLPNSW